MKAYILNAVGDFRYQETKEPEADEDSVIVKVKAAGICGSDIPRIYTAGTYSYPLIPGHEFSGVVADAGSRADKKWLKKRVGVFPLIPCKKCPSCKRKQYEMCRKYDYLGSRCDGGFAEYVKVPQWNLIELPDTVSFEQAAMFEPMAVAVHAIRRGGSQKNDKAAVSGLGTIGLFAAMFLKEMGVERIFCFGNKETQRQAVVSLGIPEDDYCDISRRDPAEWLMEATDDSGADMYFECSGAAASISAGFECVGEGGKIVLVGNSASDITLPKNRYARILRKQLTVCGSWNSSFTHEPQDDWHYVLGRLEGGRIAPEKLISNRYPFERLAEGFMLMRDKTEPYIKVMGYRE